MSREELEASISTLERSLADMDTWLLIFTGIVAFGIVGETWFGVSHWLKEKQLRPLRAEQVRIHEADADEAKKQIAAANQSAEQARLEMERLKAQVQWRRLTAEQSKVLTEAITRRIWRINIQYSAVDPEASVFAEDFIAMFRYAGIRSNVKQTLDLAPPYNLAPQFGLLLSGPAGENWAVLMEAFQRAGLFVRTDRINFDDPDADFTLTIGSKPPSF